MVRNDIIDNIVAKNKGSFIGNGFLGRFLYCRGAPKTIPASKENIPLDESAISRWENQLAEAYQIRKRGLPLWFDTDKEAFDYFWEFNAFNTKLMNGSAHKRLCLARRGKTQLGLRLFSRMQKARIES